MADNNTEDAESSSVAELNVSNIIIALHQNAIDKCKGKLGDKFRIRNSAIDDDGDKAKLVSAGEHIISVIPTEAAAKAKEKVIKKNAIDVLKLYVSWFVGPDLANKVSDSTIKPLTEAPGAKDNVPEKSDDTTVSEAAKPFMSFSQFLREADADEDANEDADENFTPPDAKSDDDVDDKKEDRKDPAPPKVQSSDDANTDTNDKNSSQLGYYITYEMNIKGLKKTKLEDSMHRYTKSLWRYFTTFFDDLTITASGIFGGGQSFTVKDVKSALRKTFGPIDPDELARNVRERIEKKFSGSSPDVQVTVQDTRTLLDDIGPALSKKEKEDGKNYSSQISKAEYALFIKVDQDDPKKQILNRGMIADIVIASIPGTYKKLASGITKNSVIHIENYKDIHGDTEKIRKLYQSVPTLNNIQSEISKSQNINDAISKIENRLEKIQRSIFRKDCERADKCFLAWEKFKKDNKTDDKDQIKKLKNITNRNKIDEFFNTFLQQYGQAFKNSEDKNLNESCTFVISVPAIKTTLLEMLFESALQEDDSKNSVKSSKLDVKELVSKCEKALNAQLDTSFDSRNFLCNTKDNIKKALSEYDLSSFDSDFGDFKNAIAFCKNDTMLHESSTDALKDNIMSILFEADPKTSSKDAKISKSMLLSIFSSKLKDAGISDIASSMFEYSLKNYESGTLNESTTSSSSDNKKVYVLPFGKDDDVQPVDDVPTTDGSNDNTGTYDNSNDISRNDIYIVPIPKMKFEDPEFANKNL